MLVRKLIKFMGNNMNVYKSYLDEIEIRKSEGLKPKPIDDDKLIKEIISA